MLSQATQRNDDVTGNLPVWPARSRLVWGCRHALPAPPPWVQPDWSCCAGNSRSSGTWRPRST